MRYRDDANLIWLIPVQDQRIIHHPKQDRQISQIVALMADLWPLGQQRAGFDDACVPTVGSGDAVFRDLIPCRSHAEVRSRPASSEKT